MPPAPKATPTWPADKVERRPVSSLMPYARNARTHSDEQVQQIVRSITEWGWTNPVLVDEAGMIIAGHGRVLAAGRLGLAEVPVMVASGWTEAQKRAYVLADNKLAEASGWDRELLGSELGDLVDLGFDISLAGFDLPGGQEPEAESAKIVDAPMTASFWLAVEGPIEAQAAALDALKALAKLPGVQIHSNLREEV